MSNKYYYANATLWWGIGVGALAIMYSSYLLLEMNNFSWSSYNELRRLDRLALLMTPAVLYYAVIYTYRKLVPVPILFIGDFFIEICTRFKPWRIDFSDIESCQIIRHKKANSIFEYGVHKEKKRERLEICYSKGGSLKTFKIRPAFIGGDLEAAVALINAKMMKAKGA